MADPRNRGEENMPDTDDEERSQASSVASIDGGNHLITFSDYTTFLENFDIFSFDIYRDFVRLSLDPNVRRVSRSKLISDVTKVVGEVKLTLINNLANLSNKVAVSADILCDYWHRFHFISVTCHWIDSTWSMQKRVIACREFNVEHTPANISNIIHTVLEEYDLVDKTSSISFDNMIADKTRLDALSQCCQSSIGCRFFHFKIINHVLSLCAQDCLTSLRNHISPIRAAVSCLTRSISLTDNWVMFCKNHDLEPKKIVPDKPNRWISTYKMLDDSFQYRETLCSFFEQQQCGIVLLPSQWDHCTNLCELLKHFKEAIIELSEVYDPTSWLVVDHCVNIALLLKKFSSCVYLGDCIARMKEKWLKYFLHIPDVFLIAKLLDPRVRIDGLEEMLTMYYDSLFPVKDDDTPKPKEIASNIKQLLFNIFREYMKNIDEPKSRGDQGRASSISDCSSMLAQVYKYIDERSGKRRRNESNPYEEVEYYLAASFDDSEFVKEFDILRWWSRRDGTFSIMSLIAKDILACHASTLTMEQAFSVDDCPLDARRSTLTVEDLENRCLLEDWISGEARIQDCKLDSDDESDTYNDVDVFHTRL